MTRIAIENSTWNNIGDAFYQSSIYHIFKKSVPDSEISMFDGPIWRAFNVPPRQENHTYQLDARLFVDADLYVFSGPILARRFIDHYGPIIRKIKENGAQYVILSAHSASNKNTLRKNLKFLETYTPLAISSRDDQTYEMYAHAAPKKLKGICAAFFTAEIPGVPTLKPDNPFVLSSFYTQPDPRLFPANGKEIVNRDGLPTVRLEGRKWPLWRITRHLEFLKNTQDSVCGYKIIRPAHDISYKFLHLNFAKRNSFISYNPIFYLSMYKSATFVVSDRVHACVTALAFGKPAIFVGSTPRAKLFCAQNVARELDGIWIPDRKVIKEQYNRYIGWIKEEIMPAM